jgi:hypothetical protein
VESRSGAEDSVVARVIVVMAFYRVRYCAAVRCSTASATSSLLASSCPFTAALTSVTSCSYDT